MTPSTTRRPRPISAYTALSSGCRACTTANGCFRKVDQNGGTKYPRKNGGWAQEISLDLDMVSAICPNCHILLVEASTNSFANLRRAENRAAAMGANVISNSWGGSDASDSTYGAVLQPPWHRDHGQLR